MNATFPGILKEFLQNPHHIVISFGLRNFDDFEHISLKRAGL